MFRISNTIVGLLNILTLLLALSAIGVSSYIHIHRTNGTDCQKVLQYPLLFGGVFVFIVSVLGIVGSLCRVNVALYAYLLFTFFVVVGFLLFTVFSMFVTENKRVSGTGYGEHKVGDFSLWLQHYVINKQNWDEVKSCLMDARVCRNFAVDGGRNNESLVFKHLSATQLGCCKPPVQCGFTMKNATFWEVPKRGPTVNDSDCTSWNNKEDKLCYDCKTCKGGVLDNIRNHWKHLTIFNVCVLILLTSIYLLGCYAIRNNNQSNSKQKYQRHRAYP